MFFLIHQHNNHWCLGVVDVKARHVNIYDPDQKPKGGLDELMRYLFFYLIHSNFYLTVRQRKMKSTVIFLNADKSHFGHYIFKNIKICCYRIGKSLYPHLIVSDIPIYFENSCPP